MSDYQINYDSVTNLAYKVASFYLRDNDNAKDVAQITAIECFLNEKTLNKESLSSWIYVVAKNKSIDFIKQQKKNQIENKIIIAEPNSIRDYDIQTEENLDVLIDNTPNNVVSIKQKQFLSLILKYKYKFDILSKKLKKNKDMLRKKTYRIQQEILLYHKILNGAERLQPIPGTKIHTNIHYFASKLKQHIEEKDLSLFNEFSIDKSSLYILQNIDIQKLINYQLCIKGHQIYSLFIAYYDNKHKFQSIRLDIVVIDNKLHIMSLPKTPTKILKINKNEMPESLKFALQYGKNGLPVISSEELEKVLQENKEIVHTIYKKK